MFGKGVYFADSSSKSANYVFASATNNIGFMLLCEVALGKMNELTHAEYMDKPPKVTIHTHIHTHTSQSRRHHASSRLTSFFCARRRVLYCTRVCVGQGCLSTKGLGQSVPDEDDYSELDEGLVVPMGKLKRDASGAPRSLLYNEYIVYSVDQIRQRYLLKVRFNYKRGGLW